MNPLVHAIYYVPPSDGQQECVMIEMPGSKRYARVWPSAINVGIQWGWVLPPDAELVYEREEPEDEPAEPPV